jgi:hypothetical protein
MSRVPLSLKANERIVRVLFLSLNPSPQAPFAFRHRSSAASAITPELLAKLSPDFVDVTARAKKIADESVKSAQIWATVIPVIVAIVMVFGSIWANSSKTEIDKLSERLAKVETKLNLEGLEERIHKLEDATKKSIPAPTK